MGRRNERVNTRCFLFSVEIESEFFVSVIKLLSVFIFLFRSKQALE